jgi:hypothetical protein
MMEAIRFSETLVLNKSHTASNPRRRQSSKILITSLWVVTPCGLMHRYRRFGGTCYSHVQCRTREEATCQNTHIHLGDILGQ